MPTEATNPLLGETNKQTYVDEVRVEMIFPSHLKKSTFGALFKAHPYEEVAYYIFPLLNENQEVGSGMIGESRIPDGTFRVP